MPPRPLRLATWCAPRVPPSTRSRPAVRRTPGHWTSTRPSPGSRRPWPRPHPLPDECRIERLTARLGLLGLDGAMHVPVQVVGADAGQHAVALEDRAHRRLDARQPERRTCLVAELQDVAELGGALR